MTDCNPKPKHEQVIPLPNKLLTEHYDGLIPISKTDKQWLLSVERQIQSALLLFLSLRSDKHSRKCKEVILQHNHKRQPCNLYDNRIFCVSPDDVLVKDQGKNNQWDTCHIS